MPISDKKVAVVTGASAGIGKSIVRQFLTDGWTVYGMARRIQQMQDIQSEGAKIIGLDLTDDAATTAAMNKIIATEGRIDALINNAGYGSHGPVELVPMEEARRQFEVNVFAVMRLSQLVIPVMRAAGTGTIVNIGSIAGRMWMPFGGWYHATKYSLECLSDAMRIELAPFGIRVVLVQPGAIATEWGGIAVTNLLANSRGTPYQKPASAFSGILAGEGMAVGPERVTAVVRKAVHARRPCRRYATPFHAKAILFMHWLLPTAVWDFALKMMLRR